MTSEERIRNADDAFYEAFHDFNFLLWLNPVNHREEQEKFFEFHNQGKPYNPQYEYAPAPPTLGAKRKRLTDLRLTDETPLESVYDELRTELMNQIGTVEGRGTDACTEASVRMYGRPDFDLLAESRQLLRGISKNPPNDSPHIGVKGLLEAIREKLCADRIQGWDVVEDPFNVALAAVDWAHHKIRLQSGLIVTKNMVERLLFHEIEIHVYRAINAERQPYKAFAIGLPGYLQTEEGLAVLMEERLGLHSPNVQRRYAGRVLAASWAERKSFFDIFNALVEFFPPEEAYTLAQRSKRGMTDTSRPGGFIQDHIYLLGRREVSKLRPQEQRLLFTGRVGVQHLSLVESMIRNDRLVDAAFVPSSFHG